jgi:arginyl-tRNA synthetase
MSLMKQQIYSKIIEAVNKLDIEVTAQDLKKIQIEYPETSMGDFSSNAALILSKVAKLSPKDLAKKILEQLNKDEFQSVEVAGPGFINFKLKNEQLLVFLVAEQRPTLPTKSEKILVEYFQPNIAKPLHIGHLDTAIIGDAIKRSLIYLGHHVESDTHMGDWGTQFGLLILAYKKYGQEEVAQDPVNKLNEYYIKINQEIEQDASIREEGKQEFVKLEQGDEENRKIWKQFVDWSMEKFLTINDLMGILPFDHHWPESFYEDKMPAILNDLKAKGLLVESQGAQIVNLEDQGLGVAVIVKSDGGTTYLLRDLATYRFRKEQGFEKQLYVVDSRQSHHYHQLFAILKMTNDITTDEEAKHIDYGFITFKGEALSTRKGNMVLAHDVISEAQAKVTKIIEEKNPDLNNKAQAVEAIAKGALKYYLLSHNRHSDIEFDWDEALDFEGNSGPYLQYTYARLSSIIRKVGEESVEPSNELTATEHQLAVEVTKLPDIVLSSMQEHLPNVLTNYLYGLANLSNKFYHESPVLAETDAGKKALRLALIKKVREVLSTGLDLLGILTPQEM